MLTDGIFIFIHGTLLVYTWHSAGFLMPRYITHSVLIFIHGAILYTPGIQLVFCRRVNLLMHGVLIFIHGVLILYTALLFTHDIQPVF